jgi:lysophospholipase L1-like esterase
LSDLEKRWKEDVIDIKPDVISILIGTNDAYYYARQPHGEIFDYDAWSHLYRSLLDSLLLINPKIKIVLCSPFLEKTGNMRSRSDFAVRNTVVHRLAVIVKQIAKDYHAVYLPFQEMFDKKMKKYPELPDTYWIWDGVHPTPAGHRLMADMWIKYVKM